MKSYVVREGGYNVIYIMENELQNEIKNCDLNAYAIWGTVVWIPRVGWLLQMFPFTKTMK